MNLKIRKDMKQQLLTCAIVLAGLASCIRDEAPNPEADILVFAFPDNSLRTREVEIYNDYIVAYPKLNVNLRDSAITRMELSQGATSRRLANAVVNDTLFYIEVTSESREYVKTYAVVQVENFPERFEFANWVRPNAGFLYENPRESSLLWYSSNNGTAIAWSSPTRPAGEYPVRKTVINGNAAAEMRTVAGPGKIAGGIVFIPCLSGSLYLGGFNPFTGLTDPLKSTFFGVPFNSGRPSGVTGDYIYREGTESYINPDGSLDGAKKDSCSMYAVLFRTDDRVQFLYGDNVDRSPNIIARAEMKPGEIRPVNEFTRFEMTFDYDSYSVPFAWDELENNEYKITIVFASSSKGQYYEGRPGNTLIVDNVSLHYDPPALTK
jgi:hypothetical protein